MHEATDTAQRTLVLSRTFDAPAALVFAAWSEPRHLVQWWGPRDFTLPHCEQDFRVGGRYRFCMRAPDGSDHWVRGQYTLIDPPHRLVFTWLREEGDDVWCDTVVALTFVEQKGRTRMTLHQTTFATTAHCDEHRDGWSECFDRLERFVNDLNT